MKIYVASSWKNEHYPTVISLLRRLGRDVYDFRNPPNGSAFAWQRIDPNWRNWTVQQWAENLNHPIAVADYQSDKDALDACDVCVLVLPAGRSACWELGYAMGKGKHAIVYSPIPQEPDLMFRGAMFADSLLTLEEYFR